MISGTKINELDNAVDINDQMDYVILEQPFGTTKALLKDVNNSQKIKNIEESIKQTNSQLETIENQTTTLRNIDLTQLISKGDKNIIITGDSISYNRYDFDPIARANAYDCYPGMLSWSFMLRDCIHRNDDYFISSQEVNINYSNGKFSQVNRSRDYGFAFNGIYTDLSNYTTSVNTKFEFEYKMSPKTNKIILYLMRNPNDNQCEFDVKVNGILISRINNYETDYLSTWWQGFGLITKELECSYPGFKSGEIVKISFENITPKTTGKACSIYLYGVGSTKNNVYLTGQGSRDTTWLLENIEERILNYNPDIVFIIIGANDIYGGMSLELYESNLNAIFRKIREKNQCCEIIFLTSPKLDSHTVEVHKTYNYISKKVAQNYNGYHLDLIDLFRNMSRTDWKADNVHLNKNGNAILLRYILDSVFPTLIYDNALINPINYMSEIDYYDRLKKYKLKGNITANWNTSENEFKLANYFLDNLNSIDSVIKESENKIKIQLNGDRYLIDGFPNLIQFGSSSNLIIIKGYNMTYTPLTFTYVLYIEENGILRLAKEGDWTNEANFKFLFTF